jgi:hypothetical protein
MLQLCKLTNVNRIEKKLFIGSVVHARAIIGYYQRGIIVVVPWCIPWPALYITIVVPEHFCTVYVYMANNFMANT